MKKFIVCASLVCLGMMSSCQKDELVPEGSKPEWLGESIYEELRGSTHLTGTFNTYLRLVDDLGYAEVLSRTGSKTIFPANDEAFERFFQNNSYGVSSYEQLTESMKKQLLYSSMLDNAMLAGMLSNIKADDNNVSRGVALKHETNISVTDSITTILNGAMMPQNNTYWDFYRSKGISAVYDATKPMLIHFTREQMLANNITTNGVDCDFGILRGEKVGASVNNSDTAYIFQTKIVNQDVTCTNGYVHQVSDVIVPPGNMAEVLRKENNTKLFSRILDYHCAPYYDGTTTNNYNAWALQNGYPTIDSVFQVRYFTGGRSQGGASNLTDPTGTLVPAEKRLSWDPGWNQYYPSTNSAMSLADIGAMLVPTDQAIKEYFLPGGGGAYFIDLYGTHPNTEENLPENLDDLFNRGNGVLTSFVNNLMLNSFIASVPSKFGTITQQGSGDFMGLTKDDIQVTDGKYDVVVANNGVIYKMRSMIAPDEYQSVIGPALIYPDLSIMGYFSKDKTSGSTSSIFGADMYYYLMAMKANYLYFIPSDDALKNCYIDPISLGSSNPRALEFYSHVEPIVGTDRTQTLYGVKIHAYNKETGEISPEVTNTITNIVTNGTSSEYASQVYDMLNYNTVVLEEGDEITNEYYLTKHGGAIRITDFREVNGEYSGTVAGGAQIDNNATPAKIEKGWKEKNGWAFRLDNVIQPSITSVNALLNKNIDRFSMFLDLCGVFDDSELLEWAGISGSAEVGTPPQQRYIVFSEKEGKALDANVNFFNGYNYTFYAPNNEAMEGAFAKGLPTYEDVKNIYDIYAYAEEGEYSEDEIVAAKAQVLKMLMAQRAFVRYHFQNNSVFADNYVPQTTYQSMYSSELGIPVNLVIASNNGRLTVKDNSGKSVVIDAGNTAKLVNKMTRDYEFDQNKTSATSIAVSSFAAVHEISEPLCYNSDGRYDAGWRTAAAKQAAARNYKQLLKMANNYKD